MSANFFAKSAIVRRCLSTPARSFTAGKIIYNKEQLELEPVTSVPGLTEAVIKVPTDPVGPGASKSKEYKNPEYFCYDRMSYFEAEIEMLKYRCPQPSNKEHYVPKKV